MLRIQVIAESICLTLALATHAKKIKSFDGKRGISHETLISDVCHNNQFYIKALRVLVGTAALKRSDREVVS